MWKRIGIGVLSVMLGLTAAFTLGNYRKQKNLQEEVAGQVIRFHILANSDSCQDQRVKLTVRQAMIPVIEKLTGTAKTREETRKILKENLASLEEQAKAEVLAAGSTDQVHIQYDTAYFPVKTYGSYTFPEGNYEALQIKIGAARGHNWWCMLYPSLCFSDALHPTLKKGQEVLHRVLSDEAYLSLLEKGEVHLTFRWF